jgi:hypothetical protein
MYPDQQMAIAIVREIAARGFRQQVVSEDAVQDARRSLQAMHQAAARYGFTSADVIRAVLGPVLEEKKGCTCPVCKAIKES